MADVPAIVVKDVLGFKSSDDGQHTLVGMRLAGGEEVALAVTPDNIDAIISALISAKSSPHRLGEAQETAISLKTFDFGNETATGRFFLRLRPVDGGHISFLFDQTFATHLAEQMQVAVGSIPPMPETPRN